MQLRQTRWCRLHCASDCTRVRPSLASSGEKSFSYDVWGNTVNIASRMESHGQAGKIHLTHAVAKRLAGRFALEDRGEIDIKGSGRMRTFFLGPALPADV